MARRWLHGAAKAASLGLLGLGLALAVWAMDRVSLGVEPMVYVFSYGFFANALPFVLLWLLLLALCNRLSMATLGVLLLAAALSAANAVKLKVLLQPVVFGDAFLIGDFNFQTLRLLGNYIHPMVPVSVLLVFIGVVFVSARFEPGFFRRRSAARLGVQAASALAVVGLLAMPARVDSAIYGAGRLRVVPWSPVHTVLHAGLAGSLLYDHAQYSTALKVPPQLSDISAFLDLPSPPVSSLPGPMRPDIVVVQSESFFDPGILTDVGDTSALLPNIHAALARGDAGTMAVPAFGGGTLRTEFEVLSGVPLLAYPKVDFPYLQIRRTKLPGLPWVLRRDGYATVAIHPNDGNFWNRNRAFAALGFERFYTKKDFPADAPHDGWYSADAALTNQVERVLDKASGPTFVMAISIEGHGPYETIPVTDRAARDRIPVPAGWPHKAANEYRNYAYHIHNADHELGRLRQYLKARGKPFILVFYGDHLPALGHVYRATAGFRNGRPPEAQEVPWLLVAGNGAQAPAGHPIQAWMMGNVVLQAAGLSLPPYYAMLARADRVLAAPGGTSHMAVVNAGIYSLARLYLAGQALPPLPVTASTSVATEGAQ